MILQVPAVPTQQACLCLSSDVEQKLQHMFQKENNHFYDQKPIRDLPAAELALQRAKTRPSCSGSDFTV